MACTGISCRQGRAGCEHSCENRDGTVSEQASNHPWDWIDDLAYPLDRALLIAVASAIVAIPYLLIQ